MHLCLLTCVQSYISQTFLFLIATNFIVNLSLHEISSYAQPPYGTRGTHPSNFGKLGDQVYLISSNFCDYDLFRLARYATLGT